MAKQATQTPAPVVETKVQYNWDELVKQHGSSSAAIRFLSSQGLKTGDIAKIGRTKKGEVMRFQHVRNVLKTPLKSTTTPGSATTAESN